MKLVSNGELNLLKKYAAIAQGAVVEIGIFDGETSAELCQSTSHPVYGIDPLIPDSKNPNFLGSINSIEQNTRGLRNFNFLHCYSHIAVKNWSIPISMIFIDGNHEYPAVKRDYEEWFPHVSQNGFILFHDSTANRGGPPYWEGPSKLTDEIIALDRRVSLVEEIDSLSIFRRI